MAASLKLDQPEQWSSELGSEPAETAIASSRSGMEAVMEQAYWLRRKREELALAGSAICAEAKSIHLDLAGRYSVKAGEEAFRPRTANIGKAGGNEPGLLSDRGRRFSAARPALADGPPCPARDQANNLGRWRGRA